MKGSKISLGTILGIPIGLDYSWFLIFILLTWTLASNYYPAEFKNWPVAEYWSLGAITAILLFASVLLHELGHSVVARQYKIPVRSITLFVFGGVAHIGAEPPGAWAEFWVAIAGPMVSFTLAGFFAFLQPIASGVQPLFALAKYLAYINGVLGLFNLIPGFPLDGGRVFRAIVWGLTSSLRRATEIAGTVGRVIAFIFILLGVWQIFMGRLMDGLWIAFVGWFLESAAHAQVQQVTIHDLLSGHIVSQVMSRNFALIPPQTTLQKLVDEQILGQGLRYFAVESHGKLVGLLTLDQVKAKPKSEWSKTTVFQVMVPLAETHILNASTDLWDATAEMDEAGANQLPVVGEGHVLGVLSRQGVVNYLRTLREVQSSSSISK